ncbi:MAG TPA: PKD domain-containing protein, partial [Flavobacteriales bacterium]|nr:PKD domain-containing protein [Flavobacteriales bacterium]
MKVISIAILLVFGWLQSSAQMTIDSVIATAYTYECFPNNTTYKAVLKINIKTINSTFPKTLTALTFNVGGSTNAANDIANLRVFNSSGISRLTNNYFPNFGTTINPVGLSPVNGSDILNVNNNYYWVLIDIPLAGVPGNTVSVELVSATISSVVYPVSVGATTFNEVIDTRSNYKHKEANVWYNNLNLGIDFNCTNPQLLTETSQYMSNNPEGTGSICDADGNLLWYSDGEELYNKIHERTDNGDWLRGKSSKHTSLFVKKPGSSDIYYLITPTRHNLDSVHYSVIDKSLDGGFGDIVTGQKNLLLMTDPVTEMMGCVNHCNGKDTWVIIPKTNTNEFHSFCISSAGLSTTPVISNSGGPMNPGSWQRGTCRPSPDGKWFVLTYDYGNCPTYLYSFDNATGIISNPIALDPGDHDGAAFSPDNSKLYISRTHTNGNIYQYDLNAANILASRTFIGTASPNSVGFSAYILQLAPDGRIYMNADLTAANYNRINFPNLLGTACNLQLNGISLAGNAGCYLGLASSFNSSFFNQNIEPIDTLVIGFTYDPSGACPGDTIQFTDTSSATGCFTFDSYFWDFDDGNTSTLQNPTHSYASSGTYDVTCLITMGCGDTLVSQTIPIVDCNDCPGNLVPNPGFELNSGIPNNQGQYNLADDWNNCGGSSPDFLHTSGTGAAQLPASLATTVSPFNGNAIMGGISYLGTFANTREYIDVQLTGPLTIGQTYDVSFYVSNGYNNGTGGIGTNNMGLHFSVGALTQVANAPIALVPSWNNPTVFYDSTWQQMSFQYTPTSAVDHITVGNFYTDGATTIVNFEPSSPSRCYLVYDDFCIVPAPTPISVSNDTAICQGEYLTLYATGVGPFTWSDSATGFVFTTGDSLYGLVPNTTTVMVSDTTDTAYINVTVLPNSSASVNAVICSG